jgi:hypothetical protein
MQLALEFGIEPINMAKGAATGVGYLKKTTNLYRDAGVRQILMGQWQGSGKSILKILLIEYVKKH